MCNAAGDEASGYRSVIVTVLALIAIPLDPDVPLRDLDVFVWVRRPRPYYVPLEPYYPLDGDLLRVVRVPVDRRQACVRTLWKQCTAHYEMDRRVSLCPPEDYQHASVKIPLCVQLVDKT
jgi:hypothetical protein